MVRTNNSTIVAVDKARLKINTVRGYLAHDQVQMLEVTQDMTMKDVKALAEELLEIDLALRGEKTRMLEVLCGNLDDESEVNYDSIVATQACYSVYVLQTDDDRDGTAALTRDVTVLRQQLDDEKRARQAAEKRADAAERRAAKAEADIAAIRAVVSPEVIDLEKEGGPPATPAGAVGAAAAAATAVRNKRSAGVAGLMHEARSQLVKVKKEKVEAEGTARAAVQGKAEAEQRAYAARDATRQAERATAVLEGRLMCVVCMDSERDTLVGPCYHLAMCAGCAGGVQECPICRIGIELRRRMILS